MAETTQILGILPINRGAFDENANYYKDNLVLANNITYQCLVDGPVKGVAVTDTNTWGIFSGIPVVQETGNAENKVMSQKAVSDELSAIDENCKLTIEVVDVEISKDNSYVGWSDGIAYNFAAYAISTLMSLKKSDRLDFTCGANDIVAVLSKVNGNAYIPIMQGGASDAAKLRTYIADEDCNVAICYVKAKEVTAQITSCDIERRVNDNANSIGVIENAIQELQTDTEANAEAINEVSNKLSALSNVIDSNVHGKILNKYDKEADSEGWSYTRNYISYEQGAKVDWRYSLATANNAACIHFYDSEYNELEWFNAAKSDGINIIASSSIPQATAYIRFSYKTDDIDSVYCKVGDAVYKPAGLINDFNYFKEEVGDNLDYKKNSVFYCDAIANTNLSDNIKKKILSAIKYLEIKGYKGKEQLVATKVRLYSASAENPLKFECVIGKITEDRISEVCSFSSVAGSGKNVKCNVASIKDKDVVGATMYIDFDALGTELFSAELASSLDDDTFENYGISYDCISNVIISESAFNTDVPLKYQAALKAIIVDNLDTTREYRLRSFSLDRSSGYMTFQICTDKNLYVGYTLNKTISDISNKTGVQWVKLAGGKVLFDFDIINNATTAFSLNFTSLDECLPITILSGVRDSELSVGNELVLTYAGEPLRLLDCGKNSGLFYLACGRKLFSCKHITKQAYLEEDSALTLVYEFDSTKSTADGIWEMPVGIYGAKELNTGNILVNACIQTSTNEEFDNLNRGGAGFGQSDRYSKFFMLNSANNTATFLFDGVWAGAHYTDGFVKRGGGATFVWDFCEYENYIFVSERNAQGVGGRAWMSSDYGITWYVIFNAYGDNGWIHSNPLYPFINPSGFDTENGDFSRPNGLTNRPNFHIHGIGYDHWRNQVIIVSGDNTWLKGSYTAVWVWKNPQNIKLWPEDTYTGYSGEENYPAGGTKVSNPVKMLNNSWTRVSLHGEDTGLDGNMQFVGIIPFKNYIAFTTDNNLIGGNGIIVNTYPQNIVSTNFKPVYALSPDSEGNTLTHLGGGHMFVGNLCLATIYRENDLNIPEDENRGACVLTSTDGYNWKRVYEDDTIDSEKNTKILGGATMIGKLDELYLRYKGFNLGDNVIRQMRLY